MVVAVAVKFGVGVALVVAAHFVLVRRWNNGKFYITQITLHINTFRVHVARVRITVKTRMSYILTTYMRSFI